MLTPLGTKESPFPFEYPPIPRSLPPKANEKTEHTTTWPELAIGLYDKLTGRNAEITYAFENLEVEVPSGTGDNAEHAKWKINGTLRIRTTDNS